MQKRTRSCFSPAKRECGLETEKKQKARSAVKRPQGLALYTSLFRGFFCCCSACQAAQSKRPLEKHESGLLKCSIYKSQLPYRKIN